MGYVHRTVLKQRFGRLTYPRPERGIIAQPCQKKMAVDLKPGKKWSYFICCANAMMQRDFLLELNYVPGLGLLCATWQMAMFTGLELAWAEKKSKDQASRVNASVLLLGADI